MEGDTQEERLYTLARLGYGAYEATCGRYRERPPCGWELLTEARREGWLAATATMVAVLHGARELEAYGG